MIRRTGPDADGVFGRPRITRKRRGQANLPVVAVALVVLTAVTGMTVAMAEGAHLGAEREVEERAAAVSLADRFVAADASHTRRANVLDAATLANVTGADGAMLTPVADGSDVRIRVGDESVLERGDPEGGTTIRRLALLATDDAWNGTVGTGPDDRLDPPARTTNVQLDAEGDVESIRVDDRVVARSSNGAIDPVHVDVHPSRDAVVSATGNRGTVRVIASVERTERVVVEVTVDA